MPPRSIWSWTSCTRNPNCVCAGAQYTQKSPNWMGKSWQNHSIFGGTTIFGGDSWQGHPIFAEIDIPNLHLFGGSTGRLVHQRRSDEDLGLFQPQESHPSLHPSLQLQTSNQPTKQPTNQAGNQATNQATTQPTKTPSQPNQPKSNQTKPNEAKHIHAAFIPLLGRASHPARFLDCSVLT